MTVIPSQDPLENAVRELLAELWLGCIISQRAREAAERVAAALDSRGH